MFFRRGMPLALLILSGCGSAPETAITDGGADATIPLAKASSAIDHLVVIVQENHTFDDHFGGYCTAAPGSNPTCNDGPACCEAAPALDPAGDSPIVLTDKENGAYTPNHTQDCELDEMDGGKMDRYVSSTLCGSPHNFAYSDPIAVMPYWTLAGDNALADRYFQPLVGQSSANDMYFARARFVFKDNAFEPNAIGQSCGLTPSDTMEYDDPTIGDLLADGNVTWAWYAEGYQAMIDAQKKKRCADAPPDCPAMLGIYPCTYDPSDVPFEFYPRFRDNPQFMKDLSAFDADLAGGALPAVSFIKGLGYHTEHPGGETRISDGVAFVTGLIDRILRSPEGDRTLVLFTFDEGGGYFDHIAPPGVSPIDMQPYGTRVPMLAVGRFARRNFVSHVVLEHSSIVKFIEWNWLGGTTGQLGNRDTVVSNIGSLLDPAATGTAVPEQ